MTQPSPGSCNPGIFFTVPPTGLQHMFFPEASYMTKVLGTILKETRSHSKYESSGLPPQPCCPNLTSSNRTPSVVTGTRLLQAQTSEESSITTLERYLDCFCPSSWQFHDFRHNKYDMRDWSFMKRPMETVGKIGQEMQKVVDFYLKNIKTPGPDKFQEELIKTMSPEQIRVLQQ